METFQDPIEISIQNSLNALPAQRSEPFTIFRVPAKVRKGNEDQYEPHAVSIGPYHHNTERLQPMQSHKRQYLRDFMARNPTINLGLYLNETRALESRVRKCYREEFVEISSEDFVCMLVLDGCFILELSFKLARGDNLGLNVRTLISDLLLIENQIPLCVIQRFYDLAMARPLASPNRQLKELLAQIPHKFLSPSKQFQGFRGEIHHLLHLCYQLFVPCSEPESRSNRSSGSRQSNPPLTPYLKPNRTDYSSLVRIPCADELFENRIVLKVKSQTQNIFDITYREHILEIPPFSIDSREKMLYANLLALEETITFGPTNRKLMSLVMLMDCLLKSTEDVQILLDRGIIVNLLQTEKDHALSFFRDLRKRVSCEPRKHHFASVFNGIHQWSANEITQEMRPYVHTMLNNKMMSFTLGFALFSLILSFTQAILAVIRYKKTSA